MTITILFISIISQLSLPVSVSVDPSGGYHTLLTFDNPEIITADTGSYPVFKGTGSRYVSGEPVRPAVTIFIPVPPGAEPELRFTASGYRSTGMETEQYRTPALTGNGLETREVSVEPVRPIDTHVVLDGIIPLAGTQLAMVSIYPVAGENPGTYASRIDIRLSWHPVSGGIPVERNRLLKLIAPAGSLYWPADSDATSESIFWGMPWARISTEDTGGYVVSGIDLQNAGCEVTGSPCSSLRLFTGPGLMFSNEPEDEHHLTEVAFTVVDLDGDGVFDTEDTIEFIGRGLSRWEITGVKVIRLQHRYATHNVYWLTWGGEAGRRTGEISGEPDTSPDWGDSILSDIWLREEHIWNPEDETTTGWVWETTGAGGSITVPFQVGSSGAGSSIEVVLIMSSSSSHTVTLYLNGTEILTDTWYGSGERILNAEGLSLSGSCSLEIRFVDGSDNDVMGLSSVHIVYPAKPGDVTGIQLFPSRERTGRYNFRAGDVYSDCMVFDISDFDSPDLLTGTEYTGGGLNFSIDVDSFTVFMFIDRDDWMSPDSIRSSNPGRLVGTITDGDRLIVVHPSLYDGVWGMIELSIQEGHAPVVALTSEIYDEFGQGITDPGAIRSAVRWGIDNWSPGLGGVILTGDGHYDILGFSTTQPVMIPPWIVLGSSRNDCLDDLYVMVHESAVLPEVPVARIPVDNLSELGVCTAKLLEYSSGQSGGTWMNRVLLVADDEWGQEYFNETEHTNYCERIAEEVVPRVISREKFYLIEYPWPPGSWTQGGPHPDKPEARESFIETLCKGFSFLMYQGHGAAGQIAHEKIMLSEDVDRLTNGARLPVSFWATCDVGHFDDPGTDAIGETLVLHPSGGCISSIAATRGTFGPSNYDYFRSVIDSLCHNPGLAVGDAVWQSKLALSAGSYNLNNRYYVMFGYPDIPMAMPEPDGSISVDGDTLRSGELNTITGSGFQEDGLAFIEILESSWYTVYTCLGGAEILYLKYGGMAFRGTETVSGGEFELDCFVPLQSTTGDFARFASTVISGESDHCGAQDPAVLIEGNPSGDDLEGPTVSMWLRGYDGVEHPEVTGDITVEAEISDSSGICLLGGSGRELSLFIDGYGRDVSSWFSYNRGSSTCGRLVYTVEALSPGEHALILWSVDGLGNNSKDTLDIRILEEQDLAITEALVYPNPGHGLRCFSFRVTEDSQVSVSIFTISGTKIEELSAICHQGYNQILWNGLDRDGDPVATGSYIYQIKADALGTSVFNRVADVTGILAVTKESEL